MESKKTLADKLSSLNWVDVLKITVICVIIFSLAIIGFMMTLRPEVSETEKRELAKFPEFSLASVWDGSYFKGISTWYSDTYPLRDFMVSVKASFENLYGNKDEQIIRAKEAEDEKETKKKKEEENLPDGSVHNTGEMSQGVYIVNNRGYELYTFLEDLNLEFANTMNRIYKRISPKVNMYVMIVPTNSGVMFGDDLIEKLGVSDQVKAVDFIYSHLDDGIKKVDIIRPLRKHNAEYLYFYTDHHWTALGAYYAYRAFCETKGIEPHDINDYETVAYPGFIGTLYGFSKKSPALASNPDTLVAYIPKGTQKMTMYDDFGTTADIPIINDYTDRHPSELYYSFVNGDHPFSYAHNEQIKDGSGVLVIKDSMGNAFIPWLIDHYEHIFWGDGRYMHSTISELVAKYNIQDVIFEVGIYNGAKPDMFKRYDEIGR